MSGGNNIGLSTIAERYAIALIELAEKYNTLDEFNQNLIAIKETMALNPDLNTFLTHPTVKIEDKKEIIDTIFKSSVSNYVLNTLKILIERNRIFILPSIVSHYRQLLNKKRNIMPATIITAINIDEATKNKIKSKLEQIFNSTIEIETETDSKIIAGVVVNIGDKVIDGSIKTKLENMKKQLI